LWTPPINAGIAETVTVDPTDPDVVWMGTNGFVGGDAGVYRSTDGGQHFTRVAKPPHAANVAVQVIAVAPSDPRTVYVGVQGSGPLSFPGTLIKTTDAGATWQRLDAGLNGAVWSVAVDPVDPSRVFAGADPNGVFTSSDGGANWTAINGGLSSGLALDLLVDPSGKAVWAATVGGVFRLQL